jgi:hypothetical protein
MRSGSWALWEPYGEPEFVTPFEDLDGYVGRKFFSDWAASHGGTLRAAPAGAGILESLDELRSDCFDPAEVHPFVREVYEHTTLIKFLAERMRMTWLGWIFHYPYNRLVARQMQQLDLPLDADFLPRRITSEVSLLDADADGVTDWRVWVRGYENSERIFYVGTVKTHRKDGPRGSQVYLDVNLPLWMACISVVFQPVNLPNGGLSLTTRTAGSYDAGMYLVLPNATRFSMLPIPGMHEEIRVSPQVGPDGTESVAGMHITSLYQWTMYTIPYTLTKLPPATPEISAKESGAQRF